ncbi:hypothetical protein ABW20_dc0109972 [Dactylellina cionopaga]|nr:hypothetical protein ABW20_dc0109972 [Dactylellina cionopaga]
MASTDLAISYAALILTDEGISITPEKIQALLSAANVDVEPVWSVLFANALKGKDVKEMILSIRATGPAGTNKGNTDSKGQESGPEGTDARQEDAKKKEAEAKDESDEEMRFGLFD